MIYGIFHKGSGLGNQLHRYVATRVLALDKGYDFGMINREGFKGKSFMNVDMGLLEHTDGPKDIMIYIKEPEGKVIPKWRRDGSQLPFIWEEWDRGVYDPDFNFIQDNTIIDGNFEDERYFQHRLPEIKEWLKTEPLEIPNNVCVIGFRGGEYYTVPELGLPKEYFAEAKVLMLQRNINMKFEVHTDDPKLAKQFFPNDKIIKDIAINWRSMRYAKYAIIANSSFYILPRLLNGGLTIAPRYFNRYNVKRWDYPQSYYKSFQYI